MDVESTLTGESIEMGIDKDSLKKVILMMTRLYADPEMAVIREYSTNAFDSHVEAGQTMPIEVTTPNQLSPFFKVRDYGVGLDADDIRNIYSQYGASTKTDSDDFVGQLGLGCKSALAYTDQFTVRGIKNGVCIQVVVSRTEDGGGNMTIVDEYPTDEAQGVEIVVPVKGFSRMDTKAATFFRFWTKGTVLVNGEEPKALEGTWLTDDLLLTQGVDQDYIVMGNVPYPIEGSEYRRAWNAPKVVSFTPIGTVDFPPSREALEMTDRTKAAIETINQRVKDESTAAFLRDIESAESFPAAITKMYEVNRMGLDAKATAMYQGEEVPTVWATPDKAQLMTLVNFKKPRYNKGWSHEARITTQYDVIFLEGYDGADFTPTKRKKLEIWWSENNADGRKNPDNWILCSRIPRKLRKWVDPANVMKWADVAAVKIVREKVQRADGRPSGSYEGYVEGVMKSAILAADIDTSKPLYFYVTTHGTPVQALSVLRKLKTDATIIGLASNRVNKFTRDFPMATKVGTTVEKMATDWFKRLSDADKLMLKMTQSRSTSSLRSLDHTQIDDPDLRNQVEAATMKKDSVLQKYNLFHIWTDLSTIKVEDAIGKYPLYDEYRVTNETARKHMYLYFNAVYAAAQEAN
jgi:hypothetical protein